MADNPSFDASGLLLVEALAVRMIAAQSDGSASFAGGNQAGESGWIGQGVKRSGRFEATYTAAQSIPVAIRNAIGLSRIPSSPTEETVVSIEARLKAVVGMLSQLAH